MATVFANNGYRIQMLPEVPRVSSPDVLIDGVTADLKKLSSHNNMVKHAKKATRQQGANLVLFEIQKESQKIYDAIKRLERENIKGKYFFSDRKDKVYEF